MTKAAILKQIRLQCVECMGFQPSLVDGCTAPGCHLYPFRHGKDPEPRKLSDEQRESLVERLHGAK